MMGLTIWPIHGLQAAMQFMRRAEQCQARFGEMAVNNLRLT
jgi:hypothetical protein